MAELLWALDIAATLAFALTGALVASRKQMDIVGFMWLAVVTGVGGGTVRDLLIGAPVFWVQNPTPVVVCLLTAIVTHFTAHRIQSRYQWVVWFDAFGMALVTIAGTAKALSFDTPAMVAVTMGVITASVGGMIRDILGQEPSIVMKKEIYVSASLAGAVCYTVALPVTGNLPAALVGIGVALLIRLLAVVMGWSMPTYRPRRGRTEAELRAFKGK